MDIHASLIDQRLTGILEEHPEWFVQFGDADKKRSSAFVLLCMATLLDLPLEDSLDLITEGGNDVGVDGLHVGEVEDGEFHVTLFQGKYKKNLKGDANFPENGVKQMINTVGALFDPVRTFDMNEKIAPRIEEIRSLIRDGYIPVVRIVLCNNGLRWKDAAQEWIDQSGFPEEQVRWVHLNHETIVDVLRQQKPVNESLRLEGEAVVEAFKFRRVLIGKAPVVEIAELFKRNGDRLLERNIRRYLGLQSNRVNTAIHDTLSHAEKRENFYFFNNGITIICNKFRHNALQSSSYQVKLEDMQIINGGQTSKTIQQTLENEQDLSVFTNVYVMVRIYELEEEDQDFVADITYATNSQNPVDLRDLRSNDPIQKDLENGLKELGYTYRRKSGGSAGGAQVITSAILAESVLAIWRDKPHQAKFRRKEHFGKLYDLIFKGLNPAQALFAVLIFRFVENERKRPTISNPPIYLPYASHFLAMCVGKLFLADKQMKLESISHLNIREIQQDFEAMKGWIYVASVALTTGALDQLYGGQSVSLQQLSATFRRGDLLAYLVANLARGDKELLEGMIRRHLP
ncbi:AIPR family protein [Magnetofaba australis]|nr:AIPR family protein [Magnetofaba australis]